MEMFTGGTLSLYAEERDDVVMNDMGGTSDLALETDSEDTVEPIVEGGPMRDGGGADFWSSHSGDARDGAETRFVDEMEPVDSGKPAEEFNNTVDVGRSDWIDSFAVVPELFRALPVAGRGFKVTLGKGVDSKEWSSSSSLWSMCLDDDGGWSCCNGGVAVIRSWLCNEFRKSLGGDARVEAWLFVVLGAAAGD